MIKRIIFGFISAFLIFSLCSCNFIENEPSAETQSDSQPEEMIPEPEKPLFTVNFDENEVFLDEVSKKASEIIDPSIETAVKMLNTVPEREYEILSCDYSGRKTEKDNIAEDPRALYWYDFIYNKLSSFEDFIVYPEDHGGEEALYLPF